MAWRTRPRGDQRRAGYRTRTILEAQSTAASLVIIATQNRTAQTSSDKDSDERLLELTQGQHRIAPTHSGTIVVPSPLGREDVAQARNETRGARPAKQRGHE